MSLPLRAGDPGTALDVGKSPQDQADAYADLLDALSISRAAIVGMSGVDLRQSSSPCATPSASQRRSSYRRSHASGCADRPLLWRIALSTVLAPDFGSWLLFNSAEAVDWSSRHRLLSAIHVPDYQLLKTLVPLSFAKRGLDNDTAEFAALADEVPTGVSCPAPIVHGNGDRLVPIRHAQQAAAAIPQSELVTVPWWARRFLSIGRPGHQEWRPFFKPQWQQLPDLLRRRRHVVGRVHGEEAVRLEREADVRRRHHRVILRPRDVRVAEGVPEHDVGVLDRPVLLGPARQAVAAPALVRVVAGAVLLVVG